MKAKSILGLLVFVFGLGSLTTSCEDVLTPDMNRYAENFTGKDTVNFYLGILHNVQDVIEQNVLVGELRGDLADTTVYTSDSVADIANFKRMADGDNGLLNRSAYYKVINQCNYYLARVDTMASKNNIRYMRKEAAQVFLIRAWTYMQLVQVYGEVPYITAPITNAHTGWEKTAPKVNAQNLLDFVRKDCEQALAYEQSMGYPNYGNFNTGAGSVAHSLFIFPADLVLGDLYLLRGAGKADYVKAARYYYEYLNKTSTPHVASSWATNYDRTQRGNTETYNPSVGNWVSLFRSSAANNEVITAVPSAANATFGTVLTRIPQIFGFDPHSTQSTSGGGESASDNSASTSGWVSLTANYKSRQIGPSQRFRALGLSKPFAYQERTTGEAAEQTGIHYVDGGDGRYYGSAAEVRTDEGLIRFIQKFGSSNSYQSGTWGFSFRYIIGIYRLRQVYLRFAEALNRAGYPHFAFGVLRGGLNFERIPALADSMIYDDVAKTQQMDYYVDPHSVQDIGISMTADELRRALADPNYDFMLDFSQSRWTNVGINELGCGEYNKLDTINTYEALVSQRILDEAARSGSLTPAVRKYAQKLRQSRRARGADDPTTPAINLDSLRATYDSIDAPEPLEANPLEIDAVESLIADECALETGYEGYRFFDLMRMANHKNRDASNLFPADNGTSWLAWIVARRGINLGLYEDPNVYDTSLYGLLLDPQNWYLRNPE